MYLVLRCFNCGQVQVQECRKDLIDFAFKCKYCKCSKKLIQKGKYAVTIYFKTAHPQEASRYCIKIKEELNKN